MDCDISNVDSIADRDTCIELAKISEQAERYEDMAKYMKRVVNLKSSLSTDERNLLSVAYKNVVGSRRSAWRVIHSMEAKMSADPKSEDKLEILREYKTRIEKELQDTCDEVLKLIDDHLIPGNSSGDDSEDSKSVDSKVFFYKMKGDYYRYLSEVFGTKGDIKDKAKDAYDDAYRAAEQLPPTHPIRLGLALNFSVFHYEIQQDSKKACELAKMAFDAAISELDQIKDESYKDSTLIMQLLRDNLTLWTSSNADQEDGEQGDDQD